MKATKKIIVLIAIVVIGIQASFGQTQGKIRVGFDLGLALPHAGAGITGDLDARYNITDNINAGILLSSAALLKDISASSTTGTLVVGANSAFLVHGDYYFGKGLSLFSPFLGAGLGKYSVSNIQITSDDTSADANSISVPSESKFGGLIRGGFELGHFRMALSYNMIPASSVYDLSSNYVGTTGNNFVNLSLGFYFGGGHWKK
ncbi:MAG: hypothetical protein PHH37_03335 [Paludibacter sp.]|nr:hypothetical protein [Paludibacter sp.]